MPAAALSPRGHQVPLLGWLPGQGGGGGGSGAPSALAAAVCGSRNIGEDRSPHTQTHMHINTRPHTRRARAGTWTHCLRAAQAAHLFPGRAGPGRRPAHAPPTRRGCRQPNCHRVVQERGGSTSRITRGMYAIAELDRQHCTTSERRQSGRLLSSTSDDRQASSFFRCASTAYVPLGWRGIGIERAQPRHRSCHSDIRTTQFCDCVSYGTALPPGRTLDSGGNPSDKECPLPLSHPLACAAGTHLPSSIAPFVEHRRPTTTSGGKAFALILDPV